MSTLKVLYVDDDVKMLRATARVLLPLGFETSQISHLADLAALDVSEFDVVLADWNPMGPAAVSAAKAAGVPVVVYTGEPERAEREVKNVAEGVLVLAKPATSLELAEALQNAFDRSCR